MSSILLNINWLALIPLGFASLFFFWLGFRRGTRFFDHESNASQKERLRDLFLSVFDLVSMVFCFLLAMSPTKMWVIMIPIGFALFVFTVPASILGGYYQLYGVSNFVPKNAGIQINLNAPSEKSDKSIYWYEFIPFVFILGWLVFFLIDVVILSTR